MSSHKTEEGASKLVEDLSRAANAFMSAPNATPPKVSSRMKDNSKGLSQVERSESPSQKKSPKSISKLKEKQQSFFGQSCDSNEEEDVQSRAKNTESSSKKRKASTALSETSTSEPEQGLKPKKVGLEVTPHGINLWLMCAQRNCLEPVKVGDNIVVELRLRA
jgi:hypothetical protein